MQKKSCNVTVNVTKMTFQGGAKMCFVFSLNAPKEYGDVVDKLTPLELMELN